MNLKAAIRDETDADADAITQVTVAAFKTLEISNHTEQFIIEALGRKQCPCSGCKPYKLHGHHQD